NPEKYAIVVPDFSDPAVVYDIEKELVGTYVTVDPLERYVSTLDQAALRDPMDIHRYRKGEEFIIGGQLTEVKLLVTKKGRNPGQEMAKITVEWNEADFPIVVFPKVWREVASLLK